MEGGNRIAATFYVGVWARVTYPLTKYISIIYVYNIISHHAPGQSAQAPPKDVCSPLCSSLSIRTTAPDKTRLLDS